MSSRLYFIVRTAYSQQRHGRNSTNYPLIGTIFVVASDLLLFAIVLKARRLSTTVDTNLSDDIYRNQLTNPISSRTILPILSAIFAPSYAPKDPLSPCARPFHIRYDAALKVCVRIAATKASSFKKFFGSSGFGLGVTIRPHSGQSGQVDAEY